MLRSRPPRWIETHGSSLNSFCGLNSSFLPALPKISSSRIAIAEVDAEPDQDFGFGLHRRFLPSGSKQVGDPLGGEGDREEDEDEDGGGEPGLAFAARPTSSTAGAISQTRPRVVAAIDPHRLLAVAVGERRWRGALARTWMPRWASQAAAATA